jgi:DNA adenine methylase
MANRHSLIKSPLRYPGGKQIVASQLVSMFPSEATEFRDPTLGGGSVFLAAKQSNFAETYWINDLSPELMCFWQVTQNPVLCERLMNELESLRVSFGSADEIRDYFKATKVEDPTSKYRQAFLYFFRNRVSFSGTTEAGGFSKAAALSRFTKTSIERLTPLSDVLKAVKITSGDFATIVEAPGQDVFLFVDPPHFNRAKIYGKKGVLNNFDHSKLANLLRMTPHRFLLTLDDCPEVRELYKWANLKQWNLRYGMTNCSAEGVSKLGTELLIHNYKMPDMS